jgi:hypothetical protein
MRAPGPRPYPPRAGFSFERVMQLGIPALTFCLESCVKYFTDRHGQLR